MKISTPRKVKVIPSPTTRPYFTGLQRQPALNKQQSSPFKDLLRANSKTQNIILNGELNGCENKIHFLSDKSTTTKVQSNKVYESVRQPINVGDINDWKILTVKQLRRSRKGDRSGSKGSQKGIELSISRRKDRSISGEKVSKVVGAVDSEGGQYENLRKLSMKGHLVNKIQIQVQSRQRASDKVFC